MEFIYTILLIFNFSLKAFNMFTFTSNIRQTEAFRKFHHERFTPIFLALMRIFQRFFLSRLLKREKYAKCSRKRNRIDFAHVKESFFLRSKKGKKRREN